MTAPTLLRQQVRIGRHFVATRSIEILALQGSPILGLVYGGARSEYASPFSVACLLAGSVFLTAHIFIFNDWSDYDSDRHDPNRTNRAFGLKGVSRFQVAWAASMLLVFANLSLAFAGLESVLLGAAIAILGLVYSGSVRFGKTRPFVATANHLFGGSLHFLLGYTLCRAPDVAGCALSVFFGLVFAGGHLNQEIRDCAGDRLNGIRTCAVAYGCRRALAGSLLLFAAAYILASALAVLGVLPAVCRWSPVLLLIHLAMAWHTLRRGLGYETALWMQRRYRALFALIALAMLFGDGTAPSPSAQKQSAIQDHGRSLSGRR